MPNKIRQAYIIDVPIHQRNRDTYTVWVPTPQIGTYNDGAHDCAVPGRLIIDDTRVHINKTQDPLRPEITFGTIHLDANKTYTIHTSQAQTTSIHDELRDNIIELTGEQIRQNNETYGEPAHKRQDKERAAEETRKLHEYLNPRLFDDNFLNTSSTPEMEL